jgi:hypothetical protein
MLRLKGLLTLLAGLVLLLFGGVAISEVLLSPRSGLRHGTVYERGYQTVRVRGHEDGPPVEAKVKAVKVRLDDGRTHTIESNELFDLVASQGDRDLAVDVQVDRYDTPKRVRYRGQWYGAGPPIWFWLGFAALLWAIAGLLVPYGIRRLRRVS